MLNAVEPFSTAQVRDARLRIPAGRGFKGRLVFVSCELMATARSDGYFPIHRWQFLRFNISIERRQKLTRCPLGGAICVLVAALLTVTAPALPAETAPSEKAEKAPTPIPLTDVASEADSVMSALRDIQTDLSSEGNTQAVARQLPRLTREIDGRLRESRKILGQSPSIETLVGLEGEWLRLRRELAELNAALTGRVHDLERYLAQIDQFTGDWNATLAAAKEESAPLEILERIDALIRELQRGRAVVERERSRTLLIQSRVGVQDARVAEMLRALRRAVEHLLDRLVVRDGVPLWSGSGFSSGAQELQEEGLNSFSTQWTALATYAERNPARLALGVAVFLALAAAFYWARRRARRLVDEQHPVVSRASIFETPTAAALLLSLLGSRWIYAQAPRLLWVLLGALALVPSVIIVGRLIIPALRTLPYALIAFFFIDQLRLLAAAMPFLPRLLFLLEMFCAIVLSIWLVRSPARCQLWLSEKPEPEPRRWTAIVSYAALAVSFAAFLANILGYITLANWLGNGLLQSSYLALVLYALVVVLGQLGQMALEARLLAALGVVRRHRELLYRRLRRALHWLAIVLWALGTLQQLLLRDLWFNAAHNFLNAELHLGSIRFSVGDVLAFAVTVWAAFALSRFIRFLLEEDVYPRVRLNRGLAYAISSTLHYVILVTGFFLALAVLGIDMTRVTILAGAFGVGVGFGLQNIFNNFISGLMVLFERPINIGDVIQIEDASGVVERIGIRASVIRTINGSEVIVPNGKLISERLTNWTLSSRLHGIELPVAVALDSDPKRVIASLEGAAAAHPLINKDPPPQALVVRLGPDSLGLELRAWTDRSEQWMQIRSELAIAVSSALVSEKIAIR
jgi:potassium-dependent mechanosensitive channel